MSFFFFFFGFLWSGEIVSPSEKNFDPFAHLCFSDVRVDSHSSPSYLQITIKTDPFPQIVTLFIGVSGGTFELTATLPHLTYKLQ